MGLLIRVVIVVLSLGVAVMVQNYRLLSRSIAAPALDLQEYWGPGSGADYKEDRSIKTWKITENQYAALMTDLKEQLKRPLKLQEPLEGIGFQYGFNTKELQKITKYWRDTYLPKWSEREQFLNQFPQYQTQIQGLHIHYIHVKPKSTTGKTVLPLLLLHGWPGSVREFYDIIPLLTTPNANSDYVYEVIAPSLPGYGWSDAAQKVNFGPAQISVIMRNLMVRLHHEKFLIHGGDWGSVIGSALTGLFPENVLGYHSTMCHNNSPIGQMKSLIARFLPSFFIKTEHADFHPPLSEVFKNIIEESGYFHIQATKPDTIGAALTMNPVGLAAYILEKFSTWTNPQYKTLNDGGLTKRFTLDALLDNVMIYYLSNSITTSQRLYSEAFTTSQRSLELDRIAIHVPSACARFRHDLMHSTDFELKDKFRNLIHSTYHKDGGHFASMELPRSVYDDFSDFVRKIFHGSA